MCVIHFTFYVTVMVLIKMYDIMMNDLNVACNEDVCSAGASGELNMNNMSSENHNCLYTSQAAGSYLRFPTTASPYADWLPCQADAACTKTVC